jgi:hypothetical protein
MFCLSGMDIAFADQLNAIIAEYKQGSDDVPLDGDEVDKLVGHIYNRINLLEGNITEEEYLAMEETVGNGVIVKIEPIK